MSPNAQSILDAAARTIQAIVPGIERFWRGGSTETVNNGVDEFPTLAKLVTDANSDLAAAIEDVSQFGAQAFGDLSGARNDAQTAATAAQAYAAAATSAAAIALAAGLIYDTRAAGITATNSTSNKYFWVRRNGTDGLGRFTAFQNSSGTAIAVGTFLDASEFDAAVANPLELSRPEVIIGVAGQNGVYPLLCTDTAMTEVLGLTIYMGGQRELEYLPPEVLAPVLAVRSYSVNMLGNHVPVASYMPIWLTPDLSVDFIPSASLLNRLGASRAPTAGIFSNGAVATPPLQYAIAGNARYAWNAVPASLTAIQVARGSRIIGIISYGQSNSEAGGLSSLAAGTRVATAGVVDRHRALMFSTGLLGTNATPLVPSAVTDFLPAQEDAILGESGGASFMRASIANADAAGLPRTPYLYRTCGLSGQSITLLGEASTPYANLLATVQRATEIAALYGLSIEIPAYLYKQGEADAGVLTQASYLSYQLALHAAIAREIGNRTRQENPVWMVLPLLVAPDGAARNVEAVTLAQVDAIEAGTTIASSCCPYWFHGTYGFNTGQGVHWKPLAKAHLLEFDSRAIRIVQEAMWQNPAARLGDMINRRVFDGSAWTLARVPFETSPRTPKASITRTGNIIEGVVPYAEGGLSIFTGERPAATNSGFRWTGTGSITGVTIVNAGPVNARWRVTLSAGSAGTLDYAVAEQDASSDEAPDCWGDLFDGCSEPSQAIPGKTLRQGLLAFSVALT